MWGVNTKKEGGFIATAAAQTHTCTTWMYRKIEWGS